MARPEAEILIQDQASTTEVVRAEGFWAVLYQGNPINIRQPQYRLEGSSFKYLRTIYSTPAAAYNLAAKLNNQFSCADFTVAEYLKETK